ncbi:MAG: FixH family protein [Planctomycetes bacterium]|nr:FixH family protein [Planctomycetota bacterium]MDA0947859.1 FixH family protein [Planctomycetota bacterium]
MRILVPVLVLLATAAAGCGGGDAAPAGPPLAWEAITRVQGHRVAWSAPEGGLPLNEEFTVPVQVTAADGTPLEGAAVEFQAEMPGHGHGMLRQPRTVEEGGGRYRVDGVLLHMEGDWVVHLDVIAGGVADRASFEVRVE